MVPWLAIAYAGAGDWDEARAYVREVLDHWPKFTVASWNNALPSRHQAVAALRARMADILCRAGTPGCELTTGSAPKR